MGTAKSDLTICKGMGTNLIAAVHNGYESVADFGWIHDVELIADIVAMLTR